jgi:NitT/TauT family transport system substrate-binding protein
MSDAAPNVSRRTILAGSAAVAVAGLAVPVRADLLPLAVGVFPTEGAGEAFYATDLGYFKDAGLDVTLTTITSASAIASALSSGSLDVGYGSVVPIAAARSRGIPFSIVAPAVTYGGPPATFLLAVAKTSTAKTGADLNGTTIAVNGLHEFSEYAALAWIEKNGGDLKSISVIEIPFPEMPAALRQGRIAAAAMAEPYLTTARDDIRILGNPLDAVGKTFAMTVWLAYEPWLEKNADRARRFQLAIQRSGAWANKHPKESAAILGRYTKLSADTLATMTRSTFGESAPQAAQVQPVIDVAVKYGALPPTKADDVIWRPA